MLKRIVVYLLLLSLTFQCLGNLGVLTWFGLNRDLIARVLCENRNKPEMHCNGQCVLMKKLKKLQDDRHDKKEARINKIEVLVILPAFSGLLSLIPNILSPVFTPYSGLYNYLYIPQFLLPPKLS